MNGAMDLGTILQLVQLVVIVLGGFKIIGDMRQSIAILVSQRESEVKINTEKFDKIERQLQALNDTTIRIARQEERLDAADQRMNELFQRIERLREDKVALLPAPTTKRIRKTG